MNGDCQREAQPKPALRVVNIGLERFYEALVSQGVEAVQLDWLPPAEQNAEMRQLLDDFL